MNATTIIARQAQGPLASPALESLAIAHYEQVYTLCHAFHADPSISLSLTNQAFRDATSAPELLTVCRNIVRALTIRPGYSPVSQCSLQANLAWLLKETTGLRYAEIATVLEMDADQVKHTIAHVRDVLLTSVNESIAA